MMSFTLIQWLSTPGRNQRSCLRAAVEMLTVSGMSVDEKIITAVWGVLKSPHRNLERGGAARNRASVPCHPSHGRGLYSFGFSHEARITFWVAHD